MKISIKEHIKNNFKGVNSDEIKASIEASFKDEEEITLPGLGVFFGIVWENSSDDEKKHLLDILENNLK